MMLIENFDDHDRSGRTLHMDQARNLLNSCEPNAILFTGGDNDTFPLWYLQEVEGLRTDVRVLVLSYFNADWYLRQAMEKHYESEPLPFSLSLHNYRQYGPNDFVAVQSQNGNNKPVNLKKWLELLEQEHPALITNSSQGPYSIIPSSEVMMKVDKDKLIASGDFSDYVVGWMSDRFQVRLKDNYLHKNALAVLDVIYTNQWKRPIYFNFTSLNQIGLELTPFAVKEGSLYRILPVKPKSSGHYDTKKMVRNIVDNAVYAGTKDPGIYYNYEDHQLRIINVLRQEFNDLCLALINEGETAQATKIWAEALELFYNDHLPPSIQFIYATRISDSLQFTDEALLLAARLQEDNRDRMLFNDKNGNAHSQIQLFVEQETDKLIALLKGKLDYD